VTVGYHPRLGALGVQIRDLSAVVREFPGEVVLLRLDKDYRGRALAYDDPAETARLRAELTRLHELFYRRAYCPRPPGAVKRH
jgi:hypothetical protein